MKRIYSITLLFTFSVLLIGCDGQGPVAAVNTPQKSSPAKTVRKARVRLDPTKNSVVRGVVTFTEVPGGIRVVADIAGLTPGQHGFHIHEKGDCSAPDASSAGSHFDPTHSKHGAPDSTERHVGDLGNIIADENGHAEYDRIDSDIALTGEKSIIGKSVIVHSDPDDFTTQPTGNAGGRVACGLIESIE